MAQKSDNAETPERDDPLAPWLEDQYRRIGIPEDDIVPLVKARVDTHRVRWLVRDKNCPVHMVAQILL